MAKFTVTRNGGACKTGNLNAVRARSGFFLLPARPVSTATRAEAAFYETGRHLSVRQRERNLRHDFRRASFAIPWRTYQYQKLNSTIMVVKATDDRLRCDAAYVLDGTMDWSVFAKRPMGPQLVIISAILRQDWVSALRPGRRYGRHTRDELIRSIFRRSRSAKTSLGQWASLTLTLSREFVGPNFRQPQDVGLNFLPGGIRSAIGGRNLLSV